MKKKNERERERERERDETRNDHHSSKFLGQPLKWNKIFLTV
jgi:hypothetical protein